MFRQSLWARQPMLWVAIGLLLAMPTVLWGAERLVRGEVVSFDRQTNRLVFRYPHADTIVERPLQVMADAVGRELLTPGAAVQVTYDATNKRVTRIDARAQAIEKPRAAAVPPQQPVIDEDWADEGASDTDPGGVMVGGPRSAVTFAQLQQGAKQMTTARDVYLLYTVFLGNALVAGQEKQKAEGELAGWKQRAAEGRVRMGKEWLTPKEYARRQRESLLMVAQALELLKAGSFKLAESKLESASKHDPESILADSLLGLLYLSLDKNPKGKAWVLVNPTSAADRRRSAARQVA